ncbi:MAG: orotidine-5'-phosphate decarboxylase [Chloroflexia bacterium]|nr:orotidine-5'-phosphate decarboxylase [Chloroflexia bacterium]
MPADGSFDDRVRARIGEANSRVCVGLDPVLNRLPGHLERSAEAVVRFCQDVIEATHPFAAAFKPNLGFFVALGRPGFGALWAVRHAIPRHIPVILDCKTNDLGETAAAYARGWFEEFEFDAITVNPYLGEDAVAPYMSDPGKGVIVLCKTSNPGSGDLQDVADADGIALSLRVADRCRLWHEKYAASVGLVVGATFPDQLAEVRRRCPDQLILLPGIGAQGGAVERSLEAGLDDAGGGLLCSASRSIIYAGSGRDFDIMAGDAARQLRDLINDSRTLALART